MRQSALHIRCNRSVPFVCPRKGIAPAECRNQWLHIGVFSSGSGVDSHPEWLELLRLDMVRHE